MTSRLGVRFLDPAGGNPGDVPRINDTGTAVEYGPPASGSGVVETIVAGTNITVDATDPANPVVSATGGAGGGGRTLIEEIALGADAASVTFANIPATYRDLQVVALTRSTSAANSVAFWVTVNGDATAGNYSRQRHYGNSSTSGAQQASDRMIGVVVAASASAGHASPVEILVPFYAAAHGFFRSMLSRVSVTGGSTNLVDQIGLTWKNTAAVSSLSFSCADSSNLVAGSRFALYGIA